MDVQHQEEYVSPVLEMNRKKWWIVTLLGVLVVTFGIGLFFILRGDSANKEVHVVRDIVTAVLLPEEYKLDGSLDEWEGIVTTGQIKSGGDGPYDALFWVAQGDNGLVVSGIVRRNEKEKQRMSSQDTLSSPAVSITISAPDKVSLPLPGFLNDELQEISNVEECAEFKFKTRGEAWVPAADWYRQECEEWFEEQNRYRDLYETLSTRQWVIDPLRVFDPMFYQTSKSRTASNVDRVFSDVEEFLSKNVERVKAKTSQDIEQEQWTFEMELPWEALPPMPMLNIERLHVMAELLQTTENGYLSALPTERNSLVVVLPYPLERSITQCAYEPPDSFLISTSSQETVFSLLTFNRYILSIREEAWGELPRPEYSLIPELITFNEHALGNGAYVCGPFIKYRKGDIVSKEMSEAQVWIDKDAFAVHRLSEDEILVASVAGPAAMGIRSFDAVSGDDILRYGTFIIRINTATGDITPLFSPLAWLGKRGGIWTDGLRMEIFGDEWEEVRTFEYKWDFHMTNALWTEEKVYRYNKHTDLYEIVQNGAWPYPEGDVLRLDGGM